jgi:hypothetical protein
MYHSHYHEEFGLAEDERPGRRSKWVAYLLGLLTAASVTFAVGYAIGRGVWTLPNALTAKIPAPLVQWLTPSGGKSQFFSATELNEYVFELTSDRVKQGETLISVRLIEKRSGRAVPGALVFAYRLDMASEGMPTMTAPLELQPGADSGLYHLKTKLSMPGRWQLSIAAKVQGETGTVRNELVLAAVP